LLEVEHGAVVGDLDLECERGRRAGDDRSVHGSSPSGEDWKFPPGQALWLHHSSVEPVTLQMDLLRCKAQELVRKEIWAHVLAYNLIRTVMAQAAAGAGVAPRSISFKATLQVLEAFRPLIDFRGHWGDAHRAVLYRHLLRAIAVHRVADRPDRFEPRMAKRR